MVRIVLFILIIRIFTAVLSGMERKKRSNLFANGVPPEGQTKISLSVLLWTSLKSNLRSRNFLQMNGSVGIS